MGTQFVRKVLMMESLEPLMGEVINIFRLVCSSTFWAGALFAKVLFLVIVGLVCSSTF